MKACRHYRKEGVTFITPQKNGAKVWVYTRDGRLIRTFFRKGLYLKYLRHLASSKKCRKKVGQSLDAINTSFDLYFDCIDDAIELEEEHMLIEVELLKTMQREAEERSDSYESKGVV